MLINFQLLQLNLLKLETSKVILLVFLKFGIIIAIKHILKNLRMIRSPVCNFSSYLVLGVSLSTLSKSIALVNPDTPE